MQSVGRTVLGVIIGIIGLVGLGLASGSADKDLYAAGLIAFAFSVVFVFWLIKRSFDAYEANPERPRREVKTPAKTAPAPAKAPAATTTKKGKAAPPALLPEEVAREKTSEQIAETREKKKEVRALRGMAGSTKGEVKKYKAQEKALDKKLAALAKSKRQQDARVARAKGRAAKAKQRAAKVEKVVCPRPFA